MLLPNYVGTAYGAHGLFLLNQSKFGFYLDCRVFFAKLTLR